MKLYSETCIIFKTGKSWDGYFISDGLLKQVEHATTIFEPKTNGIVTGLFLFDNAYSHQKRATDASSAHIMPKAPCAN